AVRAAVERVVIGTQAPHVSLTGVQIVSPNIGRDGSRRGALPFFAGALCLSAAVFVLAASLRPHMMAGMFNDEALEMLQTLDLPSHRLVYFAPTYSYPRGTADIIEAVASYANRATWSFTGFSVRSVLVMHAASLGIATFALFAG